MTAELGQGVPGRVKAGPSLGLSGGAALASTLTLASSVVRCSVTVSPAPCPLPGGPAVSTRACWFGGHVPRGTGGLSVTPTSCLGHCPHTCLCTAQ